MPFAVFKSAIQSDSMGRGPSRKCTVGDLLGVFCPSISEQVAARPYFYRTATLIQKGLIRVCKTYGAMDLTDQELQLDRRVLDCIVGLDKESNEVVEGSHLYEPKVDLASVVLPAKLKDTVTEAVLYFDKFQAYRKRTNFDEAIAYGVGLTLMFCGPSGTGKTMTANAIAAMLGKKMLLVNFPRLAQVERGQEESAFQSIFREAELSDAIIFFDECESMFAKRSSGGSAQLTELLTELERFEGIVFLATNRPYDLDEAMYRRISEVFGFQPPTHVERAQIWKLVTEHDAIPCEPSIDWDAISLQYELTGGFIKNTVIAALLSAVGRSPESPMITQADIIDGCKKQMRGALQMLDFEERLVPTAGLDELIVSESVLTKLQAMVKVEKARGVLFGPWGFPDDMRTRQGTTALFWGPPGTGRSRAAEAVGFELGKPLKVVDFPQLLMATGSQSVDRGSSGGSAASAAVKDVFKEARLMDAVLVLDGYALHTGEGGGHAGGGSDDSNLLNLTVKEMTRFPGVVILMIDTTGSLDVFVSRLDKGLLAGLKFLCEFSKPNQKNRAALWEKAMPPALPTSETINYVELAKASSEFSLVQIGNAVYRAAAAAALRRPEDGKRGRAVSMADLQEAIEDERRRGESEVDRWVQSQYM
jgi:SpoVK/Ycf46/Vps4 family AAA+-type ATPase